MSQSQLCVSDSAGEPDALLVAACTSLRQDLAAYASVVARIGLLDTLAMRQPSAAADVALHAAHREHDKVWQAVQSAARTVERTPAVGPLGRGAKVAAVHGYIHTLGTSSGQIVELDLAKSLIADFAAIRHLYD